MPWSFRRSKKVGPFRFGFSKRGLSASVGSRLLRFGRSTSGRRTASVNVGRGLRWSKSWRRSR